MHLFELSFYGCAVVYVLLYQQVLISWFASFVALYVLISTFYPNAKSLSPYRKFILANWSPPKDGIIYNSTQVRVDKLNNLLSNVPKQVRPTITHYTVKAIGEAIKKSPDMNGKLIFGNFVPYETCDVSCMVNVDGGNDVGFMLIKDVPSKSVLDICKEIQTRGKNIRPKGGDEVHKKRGRVYNLLPSFLIGALKVVGVFITSHFGINLNFLGLAKDAFGCVIVTSVGNFGYTDAYGCFVGTTGQAAFVTVNAVHEAVVAVNGKPEVAQVVNINWAIDHRYLYSGGRGQKMIETFKQVFEFPEKYLGELTKKE